jgi:rhodanese-related sulfurtransferase
MKKQVIAWSAALILLLSGCGQTGTGSAASGPAAETSAQSGPRTISAEEAHRQIQSGGELVVLDVRTAEEYAQAHIPGAILVPNEDIGDAPLKQLPVLDTEILVYCRSGNRSAQAAAKLSALGYTNVYDLGGIRDWPYETEAGAWSPKEKSGTLASFSAFDLNGVERDETLFSDCELTMINVWGTFCGPCLNELPELGKLAAAYADQGVRIVGIVADVAQNADGSYDQKQVDDARALVEQTGADYTHLLPSADLVSAMLKNVSAVPATFFVDKTGKQIGEPYLGARSGDSWASLIDTLLKEVRA